jgi:hypothetical protein
MKTSTIVVVDPEEINLTTLASLINDANVECGVDGDEIYILNSFDFPVYLQIETDSRDIHLNCYLGIKRDASLIDLAFFIKKLNDEITHCHFNFNKSDDGRIQIGGASTYSYFFGLHIESLLYQIQIFTDRFVAGCFEDEDGSFVSYDDEGCIINMNKL